MFVANTQIQLDHFWTFQTRRYTFTKIKHIHLWFMLNVYGSEEEEEKKNVWKLKLIVWWRKERNFVRFCFFHFCHRHCKFTGPKLFRRCKRTIHARFMCGRCNRERQIVERTFIDHACYNMHDCLMVWFEVSPESMPLYECIKRIAYA